MANPLSPLRIPSLLLMAVWVTAILFPLIFLATILFLFHIDAPYLDQWEFVPLLDKAFSGTIVFGDFWAQHNEHRLVFPRMVFLTIAWITRWDIRWELVANVVMGIGLFTVIAYHFLRVQRYIAGKSTLWVFPCLAFLIFSMSQWENWVFGWQLQEFMAAFAVVAGLLMISSSRLRWPGFIGAVVLGVIASFSFANGLAYWPVAAVALVLAKPPFPNRFHRAGRVIWIAVSLAVVLSYLHGYRAPDYHPPADLVLSKPFEFLLYILKYLGSPIVAWNSVGAALAGFGGVVVLVLLAVRLIRTGGATVAMVAPYVCLALFALASGIMMGVGRLGFGSNQAMSPRYITFAQFLWIANLGLAHLVFAHATRFDTTPRMRCQTAVVVIVFLGLLAANSVHGAYRWSERWAYRRPAQNELVSGNDPALLVRLHPDPSLVLERRDILRKHRLSLFHDLP